VSIPIIIIIILIIAAIYSTARLHCLKIADVQASPVDTKKYLVR